MYDFVKGDKVKSIIPKNKSFGVVGTFVKYKLINNLLLAIVKYDEEIGYRDILTHNPINLVRVDNSTPTLPRGHSAKTPSEEPQEVLGVLWVECTYYGSYIQEKQKVVEWAKRETKTLQDLHGTGIDVRFTLTNKPRKVSIGLVRG